METLSSDFEMQLWDFKGSLEYVDKWFLMGSPLTVLIIWISYLLFVTKLGPEYMKNRTPYKLNKVMTIYNAIQVIMSAAILYQGAKSILSLGLYPRCLNKADTLEYVSVFYYYFIAKIIELLDTIFFVLRKKQSQATFLHIYHHAYMVAFVWSTIKYDPSYMTLLPAMINCLVHVVMYAYYGLSAFPSLTRFLWWKKYLTGLQLIQFIVILGHVVISYYAMECAPSTTLTVVMLLNTSLFLTLFADFYIKAYLKRKKEPRSMKDTKSYVNNGICIPEQMEQNGLVRNEYSSSKINEKSI